MCAQLPFVLVSNDMCCSIVTVLSSICNISRISVSACSMITLRHSLLMQPHHFGITYLCLYSYTYILRNSLWGIMHVSAIQSCTYLPSVGLVRRFVWRFMKQSVSSYHSQVKYMTLQELLANNMRSLIRDSNKISKHSLVIKSSVKFELSYTVGFGFTVKNKITVTFACVVMGIVPEIVSYLLYTYIPLSHLRSKGSTY